MYFSEETVVDTFNHQSYRILTTPHGQVHRGRPNTLGKAFEPVKMPNLLPKGLSGMNLNLQTAVASNILTSASAAAAAAAGRGRGRPVGSYKNTGQSPNQGRVGTAGG